MYVQNGTQRDLHLHYHHRILNRRIQIFLMKIVWAIQMRLPLQKKMKKSKIF